MIVDAVGKGLRVSRSSIAVGIETLLYQRDQVGICSACVQSFERLRNIADDGFGQNNLSAFAHIRVTARQDFT